MKNLAGILLVTALVALLATGPEAKETKKEQPRFYRPDRIEGRAAVPVYEGLPQSMSSAAADTYCIVWYDFEQMDWQGWARVDNTTPPDSFFHVDDFAGLGGGSWGRLVPIEGTKSIWCGIRPNSGPGMYTCNWGAAPGYGNDWDEYLAAMIYHPPGNLYISYHLVCDTESGADLVTLEHSTDRGCCECGSYYTWDVKSTFSGIVDTIVTQTVFSPTWGSKLRFRFQSDGAFSDQDGLIDTDGACIIDSITIWNDIGPLDYEDFENYDYNDWYFGIWMRCVGDIYGSYSDIANNLEDKDPCRDNFGTIINFFNGSSYPSGDYPGLFDTPFCWGAGGVEAPCQDEMVVSPPIDLTMYSTGCDESQDADIPPGELSSLPGVILRFDAYVDLPVNNLVFRTWKMRNIENGCPSQWMTSNLGIPFEPVRKWVTDTEDLSFHVTADTIQVALGVVDMCSEWYGLFGDCASHTPSPWYDNIRIERFEKESPQWVVRRIDLFQDTFPEDSNDIGSYCRADMANDIAPADELDRIDPGDSAVVRCSAPFAGGLDTLATGEARVYCHVNVTFLGTDGKPDLTGPQLEGSFGSYAGEDGDWTVLLCEPARSAYGVIVPDVFCIDLNDSLFTRGYMIEYYFKAFNLAGESTTWPAGAESMPQSPYFGSSNLFEFTCLPTLRNTGDILYVDDFDGRGSHEGVVQAWFDYAFQSMWWNDDEVPDRYDVNGPSSAVSNGIGAATEIYDASSIFCTSYSTVIFDSGDLGSCTISDGTEYSDKSNDAELLAIWLEHSDHDVNLLVMGDNIVSDLSNATSADALNLMSVYCGVTLENSSYYELTGGIEGGGTLSPLVTGIPGGPFDGLEYFAHGGFCPVISELDVLEATGYGQYGLKYPDYGEQEYYAGIFTDHMNHYYRSIRTFWTGHSYMTLRTGDEGIPAWRKFLDWSFAFFEMQCPGCFTYFVDGETPAVTTLSQNFPNPFNPVTRVSFSLKEKGHVSMRIYDVAGRLVRVLVDDIREAGAYEVVWDGTNDSGHATASGIYFCRMEAGEYERTLKMVLLR